jgi:hypothetical protein
MFKFKLRNFKVDHSVMMRFSHSQKSNVTTPPNAKAHSTRTCAYGRLGNQIIRNVAVSLIAMKHNLKVEYCNNELIQQLGIELFSGSKAYPHIIRLTDENYFNVCNSSNINFALDPNFNFFQTKEITNFIYKHLRTDEVMSNIISKNPFNKRYNANNDLFIHIRLTDVANENPGIAYYAKTIKTIQYEKLYISTDDKTHAIVLNLFKLHPGATLVDADEIITFQFASTCKHVILSHGSFSAIIGYLSFFSNVYYPECEPNKMWHGDIFSIDDWTKVVMMTT